jgi:iron-sulfur cluster insertion protein
MKYFRIKVKGGGCSGFQYVFKSDNEINKNNDLIFDFKSLKILIDKNSIEFIDQAELDYRDELIGSSFSINNPNAKNSCGCGTSFSI